MLRTRGSTALLAAVSLGVVFVFISSSGAAILDGPADSLNDEVAIQPGDNPYTYLNEDDELVVDISEDNPRLNSSGVNPNALSAEDGLFYITYNGSEPAEVWIDDGSRAVTFVIDGQPAANQTNPVTITSADDPIPVGIRVDTRVADATPGDRLVGEITVNAEPADPQAVETETTADGDDNDDSEVVTVNSPDAATREVEVLSLAAEEEVTVDLDELHVGSSAVELESLAFAPEESSDVEFAVEGDETAPESVDSVGRSGVDPLGYYTVEFAEADRSIAAATAEIAVDRDRLAAAGVTPERVAVYRETETGWERAEMRVVDEGSETVRLRAATEGFSAFAVAAERPALAPTEASLSDEEAAPGEPVTVGFDVENVGPAPASDAEVRVETADGDALASDGAVAVDADPGATATRSVTVRLDEPGEYDLVLAGEAVEGEAVLGSVTVTERGDGPDGDGAGTDPSGGDEPDSADADEGPRTELSDLDLADFAGLAALIAIVLATLFLVRRAPR